MAATPAQPPLVLEREKTRHTWKQLLKQSRIAWLYIAPSALLMAVITFFPQVFQVWMSFTDFRIRNLRFNVFNSETWERFAPNWIGLDNYFKILTGNLALENFNFWRLLAFNIVWTVANVLFHVALGVLIAMVLNQKHVIGRRFYRAIFVLPWAIPGYIAALTWRNMFDDRFGAINQLLGVINNTFGASFATNTRWLTASEPPLGGLLAFLPLAFYAVLTANVWLGWPFMTVVATGALQSIPADMYEAASMDGASPWQRFWNVTVPMIRPAMVPAIMLGTIWTFNNFNVIYFISRGEPFGRTEILVTQAFKLVYEQRLYGVAAAFSLIIFVVLFIITMLNNRVTRATEAYNA